MLGALPQPEMGHVWKRQSVAGHDWPGGTALHRPSELMRCPPAVTLSAVFQLSVGQITSALLAI